MSFHETAVFPENISQASSFSHGYKTIYVQLSNGDDDRVSEWPGPKHTYNARWGVKSRADYAALKSFVMARLGGANSFRFKDWLDFTSASDNTSAAAFDDQLLGVGDGSATTFQLIKTYTDSGTSRTRLIRKPISGTVLVGVNGSAVGSGWTVDTTTGVITFSVAPGVGEDVTAGFSFHVPAHFGPSTDANIPATMDRAGNVTIDSDVEIIEDLADDLIPGEFNPRGGSDMSPSSDFTLTLGLGCVRKITPSASVNGFLVPAATLPVGYPYFMLHNDSGSFSITLKDGGTTVATLGPGDKSVLGIRRSGSGGAWFAFGP